MLKLFFYRRWLGKQIARRLRWLWMCSVLLYAPMAWAQAWSGILDPSRAVDWSSVGTTIATRTTICSTLTSTATYAQINSAIAACGSGQVVYLSAGTYNLAGGITFAGHSNITLRGAGPDQTILKFTAGNGCGGLGADVCVISSPYYYIGDSAILPGGARACNWTAGYTQGTTSITLNSCGGTPPVNQFIILDQANDASDTGGVYVCSLGSCNNEGSTDTNGRTISGSIHGQPQVVYVSNVSGSGSGPYTVTITPGLYANNWRTGQAPGAWWPGFVSGDGIENLTVDHTSSTSVQSGTYFYNAYGSWMKNVRSINSNRNQVWLYQSARIVVRDSYFYGTLKGAQESYGIEFWISSDDLVENSIFQHIASPIETENYSGSVVGHNYSIDDYFPISPNWLQVSYPNHGAGGHMNLYEGNNFQGLTADDDWGTAAVMTYFRNQVRGWETNQTMNTNAIQTWWGNRGYNFIGNVLGTVGYHNQYQVSPGIGSAGNCAHTIYSFGYRGTQCGGTSETLPYSTSMRWGNYDTVNAAVRWDATESSPGAVTYINAQSTPASHTLPASFYLAAKPSWWTTPWGVPPWPAIGPDVTGGSGPGGYAYLNPAQTCYNHTSIDSAYGTANVLLFNANNCYAASSATYLATFSPTSIAFGNQIQGTTSSTHTITVTSAGTGTLTGISISLTGTNPTQFAQTNNCGTSLASGATSTISTTFTPTSQAAFSANVQFVSNGLGSPQTVPLTGTGTAPATPTVTFTPTSLAFGNQATGTTSGTRSVTLANTGTGTLTITSIAVTGGNSGDFGQSNNCGATLSAGSSCVINVNFTPTTTGARASTVQTVTNASDSPESFAITGTGVTPPAPAVHFSPTSLAFGNQLTNVASASQAITMSNTGSASLTISGITLTGANSAMFGQTNNCGGSLAVGGSCTITVTFTPTSTGAKTASVQTTTNASDSPETVPLTGTGVAPAVTFGAASLSFGNQITNTSSAVQTVSLTNSGTGTLTISSVSLTGTNANQFLQTNNCPASLAASNACTISVTFTPTSNGAKTASVSVTDNASGSPQTVSLTGTGVAAPTPLVTFSPTSVAFGTQTQSTTSGAYAITVTDSGSGTLTISNVTLIGTNAADFAQTNNCTSLTAGSSCTINVTFTPSAIGARSASVQTTTNAADSPETVAMTGTGTAAATPIVTFNHAVLNFGNQTIATPSTPQTVTLTNSGTADLTITSIAPAGTNATDFSQTNDCGATLSASAFCTITVTFNPALTGQKSATIRTTTNAADSPENVNLTGNGIYGSITVPNSPTGFIIIVE